MTTIIREDVFKSSDTREFKNTLPTETLSAFGMIHSLIGIVAQCFSLPIDTYWDEKETTLVKSSPPKSDPIGFMQHFNPDCRVDPQYLAKLEELAENQPHIHLVAPRARRTNPHLKNAPPEFLSFCEGLGDDLNELTLGELRTRCRVYNMALLSRHTDVAQASSMRFNFNEQKTSEATQKLFERFCSTQTETSNNQAPPLKNSNWLDGAMRVGQCLTNWIFNPAKGFQGFAGF